MLVHARKLATTLSLIALILLSVQAPATAKVARISFEELIQNSDIIVLAQVEAVRTGSDGQKIAEADVLESWKGESAKAIKFLASPTWTCDIADAVEGEHVVLFLGEKPFPRFDAANRAFRQRQDALKRNRRHGVCHHLDVGCHPSSRYSNRAWAGAGV